MRTGADVRAAVIGVCKTCVADRLPDSAQSFRSRGVSLRPRPGDQERLGRENQQQHHHRGPQDQQRQHLAALVGPTARAHPVKARTPQPVRQRRRRDEAGGAVTLLVMLMVPVCVLAAVVSAAMPRRLAAHAAADAAADSLASVAVAWRDAQARDHGALDWFFDDCTATGDRAPTDEPAALEPELRRACEALTESLLEGLTARGFNADTVVGFYSSAYTTSAHPTMTPDGNHSASLPCHTGGRAIVADAVHLGLAAGWATADWAASQTWPQGLRITAESVGTIALPAASGTITAPACGGLLDLAPLDARPASENEARQFAESLPTRTAFGN